MGSGRMVRNPEITASAPSPERAVTRQKPQTAYSMSPPKEMCSRFGGTEERTNKWMRWGGVGDYEVRNSKVSWTGPQ